MGPRCSNLVTSWVLMIGGIVASDRFGNVGIIAVLPLFAIVRRIRGEYDRETFARYKHNMFCMMGVLLYYVLVLTALVFYVAHYGFPSGHLTLHIVVFMLPVLVGMLVADYKLCSTRRAETLDS
jgi:small-conductance mechanosensitive channel